MNAKVTPFVAAADDASGFATYKDCYKKVLASVKSEKNSEASQNARNFVKENGFDGLAAIETTFSCSGLCFTPLFYATIDYKTQPAATCAQSIKNTIGGAMGTASIILILTAVISFCGFCGSFPLCKAFDKEEGEDGK